MKNDEIQETIATDVRASKGDELKRVQTKNDFEIEDIWCSGCALNTTGQRAHVRV